MQSYCAQCGEKRPERDDWKLQSIASEAFAEITSLEHSKVWQTLKLLLIKPGQLTREYWSGRRKAYLGPLKLYLVFFAVTLVLYSIHQPTAVYDVRTMAAFDRGGQLPRLLDKVAQEAGESPSEIAEDINSRWQMYVSWSQLLYPLFVALALKLLFARRGLYFAEHLIFALHVLAFTFLSFILLWPSYFLVGEGLNTASGSSLRSYLVITAVSVVWTAAYLALALRRAYGDNWLVAMLKGLVIFLVYFLVSMVCTTAALFIALGDVAGG
jgi:hypothetical protein